jgi:hypothetical protein
MTALAPSDNQTAAIQSVYQLGQTCTQGVDSETSRRIRVIRERCTHVDYEEQTNGGVQGWRKAGHSNHHQSSKGNQSSHHNQSSSTISKWRGNNNGSHQSKPHSSGSSNTQPPARYVSYFNKPQDTIEDKVMDKINEKLNKFGNKDLQEVQLFLQQILDSDDKEFLQKFITLMFTKASNEPMFCSSYATIISNMIGQYPLFREELTKLYTSYLQIFKEVNETSCTNYQEYLERNSQTMQRRGYSQFLAELTRFGILTTEQLFDLYRTILQEIQTHGKTGKEKEELIDEYVVCLLEMTKVFRSSKQQLVYQRTSLANECEPTIQTLIKKGSKEFPGLGSKSICLLMDCQDILLGRAN